MQGALFWALSAGAVIFAVLVVAARSPVSSALALASSMMFVAGLMIHLNAPFLGAVQVLVYAGAVIVLFLFMIMLMDLRAEKIQARRKLGLAAGIGVGLLLVFAGVRGLAPLAGRAEAPAPAADEVRRLGRLLFTEYVLPLEVTGVLLLVAMVGVMVLCRPGGPGDAGGRR